MVIDLVGSRFIWANGLSVNAEICVLYFGVQLAANKSFLSHLCEMDSIIVVNLINTSDE